MNTTVTVLPLQSIFDIALAQFGSIESAFLLLGQNKAYALTDFALPGARIFANGEPVDPAVIKLYNETAHQPVSLISYSDLAVAGDFNNDFNNDYNNQ